MIRPHARRRLLPVVLLVVLLAFGCDSDAEVPDDEDVAATRDEAEGPAGDTPTPTSSPAGDADEGEPEVPEAGDPPSLDGLSSDDELEVARTGQRFWAWLLRHPDTDPAFVERIMTQPEERGDGPTLLDEQRETIRQYQEHEWWWRGGTSEVVHVEVLDDWLPIARTVRVYFHRAERAELVDTEGQVHSDRPPAREWWEEAWVREDRESPWKVVSVGDHGEWEEGDL